MFRAFCAARQTLNPLARSRILRSQQFAPQAIVRKFATQEATFTTATAAESDPLKWVRRWLYGCAGMVFGIVVVGGTTRLTNSGLSMVDWKFHGEKLPLNETEWEAEFEKYKQFPEYKTLNPDMTLPEFKNIFFWEFTHRMLGRSLGLVFVLPFGYFMLRKRIPRELMPKLFTMLAMGGGQGLLGWYMVKSGLNEADLVTAYPTVSPYRLAAHLASAFAIFMFILWTAMSLSYPRPAQDFALGVRRVRYATHILQGMVCTTVISGAFVAGLDAGFIYNEFPLMGGSLVPSEWGALQPMWKNFTENPAVVQFTHRVLAISTYGGVVTLWVLGQRAGMQGRPLVLLHTVCGVGSLQVILGITALLTQVPVPVGVMHQAGSLTLLGSVLALMHSLRRPGWSGTGVRGVVNVVREAATKV